MAERTELLEAALDSLPEAVAVVGAMGRLVFWNQAAAAITGYPGMELVGQPAPAVLEMLLGARSRRREQKPCAAPEERLGQESPASHGARVYLEHKLGHEVPAMVRILVLRDALGERIGQAIVFHPADSLDALPHGEYSEGTSVEKDQTEFEERLQSVFEDFQQGGESFGVLWITVDQAQELRRTHGAGACEAMLGKVERTLVHGLRPAEEMGRWGDDEFLVISHERTPEMLAEHAQLLAGLARTTDFRWWGDRASLTVSVGAAQASQEETLGELLERAKTAMFSSFHAGGNHITLAPGRKECLPS
ncbi:MAG: diguanylate cyclase domain-containing protein [Terracidiphilus sp.]